jgi:hypothetical protein
MPKNLNTKKKACAQEIKAIINSSSDEQYSLASDLVDFDNGIQYEVSVRREEIKIFLNHIEDTNQSSFVILAKAIVGGQGFDRYHLELSEIAKIEGEHPKSNNANMRRVAVV